MAGELQDALASVRQMAEMAEGALEDLEDIDAGRDSHPFRSWRKGEGRWTFRVAALGLAVAASASLLTIAAHSGLDSYIPVGSQWHTIAKTLSTPADLYLVAAHIVVVFGVANLLLFRKVDTRVDDIIAIASNLETTVLTAGRSVQGFWRLWLGLWISWFLLYFAIGVVQLLTSADVMTPAAEVAAEAISNGFNNITAAVLLAMWWELDRKTRAPSNQRGVGQEVGSGNVLAAAAMAIVVLAAIDAGICYWLYASGNPAASLLVSKVFALLSGLVSGLSLAILVGRLDSKFFSLPRSVIFLLFTYACVQALFPFVSGPDRSEFESWVGRGLLSFALFGKLLLFGVIQWLIEKRDLLWYMLRVRQVVVTDRTVRTAYFGASATQYAAPGQKEVDSDLAEAETTDPKLTEQEVH